MRAGQVHDHAGHGRIGSKKRHPHAFHISGVDGNMAAISETHIGQVDNDAVRLR